MGFKEITSKFWTKETFYEIAKFIGVFLTLCGSLWFIAEIYLSNYVDNKIELNDKKLLEAENKKKTLDQSLSEVMDIPIQMVPYEIAWKFQKLDSLFDDINSFSKNFLPYLERETTNIIPKLRIDPETGDEWWLARDGKEYRVGRYEHGSGYIWYHGDWVKIFE